MLVATFFAVTSLNNIYAAGEEKNITFEDENLYNAIKEKIGDKILSSNDSTKTITMIEDDINSIKSLDMTSKNITNIKIIIPMVPPPPMAFQSQQPKRAA